MAGFLAALKQYIYGAGWLVICVAFCIFAYKMLDKFIPIDFKKEIEEQNMAFAVFAGLIMFGLALGVLLFAGQAS